MLDVATQLGRYRLGEQIGSGAMAEVFRGELSGAEGFSRPVAIKRVRARLVGDSDTARGFIDEARLAQRLQHGNIVQTHDLGIENGVPYIVMEFVDGLSLAEVIAANHKWDHRLGIATSLYAIEAVASALDYAHRLADAEGNSDGVVHRDVNPRNILLSSDGIVKLTDFGIAKGMNMKPRTLPGRVKGTLGYLSPEQAYGGIIGPPTDQFATGVVLYQLLAGHNPLAGAGKIREYRKMLDDGLPPLHAPEVDEELRAIVARATASKMDQRFASMSEFRQVLEAWRVERGIRTSLDGVREIVRAYRGHRPPRKAQTAKLDDALLDQLGAAGVDRRGTKMIQSVASAARTSTTSRTWIAVVAALVAAAALVTVIIMFAASDEATSEPRAAQDDVAGEAPENTVRAASTGIRLPELDDELDIADAEIDDELDIADAEIDAELDDLNIDPVDVAAEAEAAAAAALKGAAAKRKAEAKKAAKAARQAKKKAEALKAKGSGIIRINVLPYAEVSVDGARRGRTPRTVKVSAGSHTVRLRNPATGKTSIKKITVADGETKLITSW